MAADFPLFVVGAPRSGTTLVQSILQSSEEFVVYEPETHLLECRSRYGSLSSDARYEAFLADWTRSRQMHHSGLEAADFRAAPARARRTWPAFLRFVMESMAAAQGRARWVEKTPAHVHYMAELGAAFPHARFVHVIRDGRASAVSIRRLGWTGVTGGRPLLALLNAADAWEGAVVAGRSGGRVVGPERYLELRYEDLVQDLESALALLAAFARIDLAPERVRTSDVGALSHGYSALGPRMRGVSDQALERWREELDERETAVLGWRLRPRLRELGYDAPVPAAQPPLGVRLAALWGPTHSAVRRALKRRTLLGRLATSPLEF